MEAVMSEKRGIDKVRTGYWANPVTGYDNNDLADV